MGMALGIKVKECSSWDGVKEEEGGGDRKRKRA